MIYRERLWPSPSFILGGAAFGAGIGLVMWVLTPLLGVVVGAVAAAGIVATMLAASSPVVVDLGDAQLAEQPVLMAGSARIEAHHLGEVRVLDADAMRATMGPQADARAYVCQRPWLTQAVQVAITDPHDPAPYWLVASRHPRALARAVEQAAQAAHSEQTS